MYSLYFKIAVRYLLKHKLYSFINIAGLVIGIVSFILILISVQYEYSYDKFEGSDQVYRVYMDYLEGDSFVPGAALTYNSTGSTLERGYPEVIGSIRFYYFEKVTFIWEDKILEQPCGSLADQSVFDLFDYSLLKGDVQTALKKPNSIVLTESLSNKILGELDPIGQTLSIVVEGEELFLTVTGVMEDLPPNTHFKNTFFISMNSEKNWDYFGYDDVALNWSRNNYYTYIKLDKDVDVALLRQKIINDDMEGTDDERHNLEPIQDIHLYSDKPYEAEANGSITRTKFLITIAFIIIILSWLNYINLNTSKSLERAREVGIRKVVGAQRSNLIIQSLIESIVLNLISLLVASMIAISILPVYNNFMGQDMSHLLTEVSSIVPLLGVVLIGMILAGLYPAFLLSSFSPLKALNGKVRASANGLNIRKVLIICQFLVTILLIISSIVITKQIRFLQDQPIGTSLNNLISLNGEIVGIGQDSILKNKFEILEIELRKLPFVDLTTSAETFPGDNYENLSANKGVILPNGVENNNMFHIYAAQPDYFELTGIEFAQGNTFLRSATGNNGSVVINEKFVKYMGLENNMELLNKRLGIWGQYFTIVGIIKDYHHFGLQDPVVPMVIRQYSDYDNLLVKLNTNAVSVNGFASAIQQIRTVWDRVFPQSTFNYTLLDKKYEAQYRDERRFGLAVRIFTLLAIFIALLGLFGLTSYTCLQRKKEIGIRKVNGASVIQIMKLLNVDFLKWVGIAFIFAVPFGYYAMRRWLEDFAYKTSLDWWIFALAGIIVIVLTILTVSWQSFNAAIKNPIEAVKVE